MKKQIIDLKNDLKIVESERDQFMTASQKSVQYEEKLEKSERFKSQAEDELKRSKTRYESEIEELHDNLKTLRQLNTEFKLKISELEDEMELVNQNNRRVRNG